MKEWIKKWMDTYQEPEFQILTFGSSIWISVISFKSRFIRRSLFHVGSGYTSFHPIVIIEDLSYVIFGCIFFIRFRIRLSGPKRPKKIPKEEIAKSKRQSILAAERFISRIKQNENNTTNQK